MTKTLSNLVTRAVSESERAEEAERLERENREIHRREWLAQEQLIRRASEDALRDFLAGFDGEDTDAKITLVRISTPNISNAGSSVIEATYDVDGIKLLLRCHYKATGYEAHPFDTWGVFAVNQPRDRVLLTHVKNLAELGDWIRHYRPELIEDGN